MRFSVYLDLSVNHLAKKMITILMGVSRVIEGETLFTGVCGDVGPMMITGGMFCSCSSFEMSGCAVGADVVTCPITPQEANGEIKKRRQIDVICQNFIQIEALKVC